MPSSVNRPVMVTGAAGQLGRQIIENLMARENVAPSDIVAGTRDPSKLAELAARGVQVRRVDFDDEASLDAAFKGVGALLIISTDAVDKPRAPQHIRAVNAASRAGVGHVLYTSIVEPEPESPVMVVPDHHATEQAIRATGLPHTFLRHGLYLDNFLMNLPAALKSGQWYSAAGDGRTAHVSRDDCARADAAALASAGADSRVIVITGPAALTHTEIGAALSAVTGRTLNVVKVGIADLVKGMEGAGLPGHVAAFLAAFDAGIEADFNSKVGDGFRRLTGQAPESFRDFFTRQKAAFAS